MGWNKALAAGLVALFLGGFFLILFVPIVIQSLSATTKPDPGVPLVAFSTAVAGYVGGVIALWLGAATTNRIQALGGKLLPPAQASVQTVIGFAYIVGYFGVALLALYIWVSKSAIVPDLLTTDATASAGLAFAIVTKLYSES
jgi:hypothetical protein